MDQPLPDPTFCLLGTELPDGRVAVWMTEQPTAASVDLVTSEVEVIAPDGYEGAIIPDAHPADLAQAAAEVRRASVQFVSEIGPTGEPAVAVCTGDDYGDVRATLAGRARTHAARRFLDAALPVLSVVPDDAQAV